MVRGREVTQANPPLGMSLLRLPPPPSPIVCHTGTCDTDTIGSRTSDCATAPAPRDTPRRPVAHGAGSAFPGDVAWEKGEGEGGVWMGGSSSCCCTATLESVLPYFFLFLFLFFFSCFPSSPETAAAAIMPRLLLLPTKASARARKQCRGKEEEGGGIDGKGVCDWMCARVHAHVHVYVHTCHKVEKTAQEVFTTSGGCVGCTAILRQRPMGQDVARRIDRRGKEFKKEK